MNNLCLFTAIDNEYISGIDKIVLFENNNEL